MGTRGWIIFIAATALLLGGLVVLSNQNRLDVSSYDAAKIITANDKNGSIGDHVYGNKNAKVILIEYGDYQCPGCTGAYERVKVVTDKYKDHLAFVFRNLPLTQIHPHARAAAATAEAAGLQGKYWEMQGKLYETQKDWAGVSSSERTDIFATYAEEIGLDMNKYNKDLTSENIEQKIRFDQAIFKSTGLAQSTPAFVLNGEKMADDTWKDEASLDTFIRGKLIEAGVELPEEAKITEE